MVLHLDTTASVCSRSCRRPWGWAQHLERLDVEVASDWVTLPATLAEATELRELRLVGAAQLKSLPAGLAALTSLKRLDLPKKTRPGKPAAARGTSETSAW